MRLYTTAQWIKRVNILPRKSGFHWCKLLWLYVAATTGLVDKWVFLVMLPTRTVITKGGFTIANW